MANLFTEPRKQTEFRLIINMSINNKFDATIRAANPK